MPTITLDSIDPPIDGARKRPASAVNDAELQRSIATLGILQPLLVLQTGNRYAVVDGERRRRMAIAAGLASVPAHIFARADEGAVAAASAAANMVRLPLEPLDQWRAIIRLQSAGYTLDAAADALGVEQRLARRMDKLGRLHPEVLVLIEESDEIPWDELPAIANAAPDVQAAALKGNVHGKGEHRHIYWNAIEHTCRNADRRIERIRAIFNIDDHPEVTWEEDFFAQPGHADQFTTTDVAAFIQAQQQALAAQVKARKGKLKIADYDPKSREIKLPAGWSQEWGDTDKPKKHQTVFVCVEPGGHVTYRCAVNRAEMKKKEAEKKKKAAVPDDDADEAGADIEEAAAAEEKPGKGPINKSGLTMLAEMKTEALRQALRDRSDARTPTREITLIAMLTLALHAWNVQVSNYNGDVYSGHHARDRGLDMVRRLIEPGGQLTVDDDVIRTCAMETLARALGVAGPDDLHRWQPKTSGPAAEWIGAAMQADRYLPRMDTEAFLATLAGAELKQLAATIPGRKLSKVGELKKHLPGKLPDWRPTAAQFGAPRPEERERIEGDGQEGEDEGGEEL